MKIADKINCAHKLFRDIVIKHQMTISTSLNLFFDRNLNISIIRFFDDISSKNENPKMKNPKHPKRSENLKHCINVFRKMFIKCLGFPDHFISFPKTFDVLIYLKSIHQSIQNSSENFFINYLKSRY